MRTYEVYLKDNTTRVKVEADDVELDNEGGTVFWNFLIKEDDEDDAITVAAFPFHNVAYVLSAAA